MECLTFRKHLERECRAMKYKRRMCAVCGDKNQTNVSMIWKRLSDEKAFHVCLACVEAEKVNPDSVTEKVTKTYTTILNYRKND